MDQMMHALQQQDGSDKLVKVVKTAGGMTRASYELEGDDGEQTDTCGVGLGGMEACHCGVCLRDLSGDLSW